MAGSTPPKKDPQENQEKGAYHEYELNLEMWRHYDNLRQEKSKTFLTAQTILIAVSGFVFKSQVIFLATSLLGLWSSVLWFLLLVRNAGYIRFHRGRVRDLEADAGTHFTTFKDKWDKFDEKLWPKSWSNTKESSNTKETSNTTEKNRPLVKVLVTVVGSSNWIDRMLAALFVLFWLCLSVYSVVQ